MMNRLSDQRTSSLNQINIKYGNERVKFNLFDEVAISTVKIEKELKTQPSYYGFLLLLRNALNTEFETLNQRRKAMKAKLYKSAREQKGVNGRYMADEDARMTIYADPKFKRITDQCILARHKAGVIHSAVMAFEQ